MGWTRIETDNTLLGILESIGRRAAGTGRDRGHTSSSSPFAAVPTVSYCVILGAEPVELLLWRIGGVQSLPALRGVTRLR